LTLSNFVDAPNDVITMSKPKKVKVKNSTVELWIKLYLTAMGCHLQYGITQCYLSPDTSEYTPP